MQQDSHVCSDREWARTCALMPTHKHNPSASGPKSRKNCKQASKQVSRRRETRTQFMKHSKLPGRGNLASLLAMKIHFGRLGFTRFSLAATPRSRTGRMLPGTWQPRKMQPSASHACLPPHLETATFQMLTGSLHRRRRPSARKSTRTSWPAALSWHILGSSGH